MKTKPGCSIWRAGLGALALCVTEAAAADPHPVPVPESLKAYCIDFNWGPGGPNAFPKPGHWADADPAEHAAWYRGIGCNVIQTFAVSCNGYAWYKGGVVPEQPGLLHDFLPEMVRLAHRERMLVFGYFCAGANTRWGLLHPEQSYSIPSDPHLVYTDDYLAYLDGAIRDAIRKSGMDGFMVDWLRMPTRRNPDGTGWLDAEKALYAQLMGEPFPGEGKVEAGRYKDYGRRALDRCWQTIRKAARETDPACLVWLTSHDLHDPHLAGGLPLRDADWLLNEAGDLGRSRAARTLIGPKTRLLTCLAAWNKQDPAVVIPDALKSGIGLYGFTKPTVGTLKPPVDHYLGQPVSAFKNPDDRHIAALARAYLGLPVEYVRQAAGAAEGTGEAR